MSIKEILKRNTWIVNLYHVIEQEFYEAVALISPMLNTEIRYQKTFGRRINLKAPKTFNEKIQWLKLNKYMKDPLVIQCADKCRVRDYIVNVGRGDI